MPQLGSLWQTDETPKELFGELRLADGYGTVSERGETEAGNPGTEPARDSRAEASK